MQFHPAASLHLSARPAAARARCCGSSSASTGRPAAPSSSTARTCTGNSRARAPRRNTTRENHLFISTPELGESLRALFSVVTQDAQIFNGTIRDNIAYGKLGATDDEILAAARAAELVLDAGDLTLDKDCGEKGAKLSGGQQQRVSLARAILKSGSVFLLDEPTTGLDNTVAKSLQATLDALSAESTTLCITHHLEDLRAADQILYLDGGRVVERGSYDGLMEQRGAFFDQVNARR